MTRNERAKQFLPFDAMKGLTEELHRREERHSRVPMKELSETQQQEINTALSALKAGDRAEITYYLVGHYVTETVVFRKNDLYRNVFVAEEKEIPFSDIFAVELLD